MKYLVLILLSILTVSCADSIPTSIPDGKELVGFWHGIWHGMILPISFIVSLFDPDTDIYAIYNNGGWYNFGFVIGAGTTISSSSSGNRKR